MPETPQTPAVADFAEALVRHNLHGSARLLLDLVAPLDVINSQLALFSRPFLSGSWRRTATALSEPEAWQHLRNLLP